VPDLLDSSTDSFSVKAMEHVRANMGELATAMSIEITQVSTEAITASMPVVGNRQPFGLLHGGASAVLAETLGSIHSALLAPPGKIPVGIELSCSHHRAAREGDVIGTSTPITAGRTLAAMAISIRDSDDRLICTARLTCMYRDASS